MLLGGTIDDAAGEAFDKVAKMLGLGYPGGPAIDRESESGDPDAVRFPRALRDRPYDLSFSGLKTSVVTYLEKARDEGTLPPRPDVSASVQEAIIDVLVAKTFNAVAETGVPVIAAGGGVLANRRLRAALEERAADEKAAEDEANQALEEAQKRLDEKVEVKLHGAATGDVKK